MYIKRTLTPRYYAGMLHPFCDNFLLSTVYYNITTYISGKFVIIRITFDALSTVFVWY